jgi:hypothetical protein
VFGRQHYIRRAEAAARQLQLGDGAEDALFEFENSGIARRDWRVLFETLQCGAQYSDEPRG